MGSGGLKENNSKYHAKDYEIIEYISEGAWGKVYAASHKITHKKVALKFFGYTANQPLLKDIQRELNVMLDVNGISGVVQTFGHFIDTAEGIIPDKVFKEKYLVIVMELLEGGHMLSRVNSQKHVSEHYIALAFKRLIIALDSLHRKQFIHRDIKLENIMFLEKTDYSPVKVIDLGMMVHCPVQNNNNTSRRSRSNTNNEQCNLNFIYQDKRCRGTPGYLAPESITSFQYSPKSDLWQAGCVLYSLLSGMPAFNPNIPEQATDMTYFPMRGHAWDNVSDLGKDLVSKILKKDPNKRLSSIEILDHPWILEAPNTSLGDEYLSRIKHLVLRQRLKAFFVDNKIEKNSKERRQHLEEVLPFLSHYSGMKSSNPSTRGSPVTGPGSGPGLISNSSPIGEIKQTISSEHIDVPSPIESPEKRRHSTTSVPAESNPSLAFTPEKEFRDKLRTLKIEVIRSVSLVDRGLLLDGYDEEVTEALKRAEPQREIDREKSTPGRRVRHIHYDAFVSILHRCELPELANRQVFNIFDWKNLGTIDMKEFLMTMLAFQPPTDFDHQLIEEGSGVQENSCSYDSKESGGQNEQRVSLSERFPQYSMNTTRKNEIDEEAVLYFKMFDVYERGYLSLEDLKIGIECILYDPATEGGGGGGEGHGQGRIGNGGHHDEEEDVGFNIEALFDAIDVLKTGKIEFKEFVVFYRNLLTQTMGMPKAKKIRSKSRSMGDSALPPQINER